MIFSMVHSVIPRRTSGIFTAIPARIPTKMLQISTIPAQGAFAKIHSGSSAGTYPAHYDGTGFPPQIPPEKLISPKIL